MKALIHENVALAPLTTFGIGGPARYFIDAPTDEALLEAIPFAKDRNLPVFILGGGSNQDVISITYNFDLISSALTLFHGL